MALHGLRCGASRLPSSFTRPSPILSSIPSRCLFATSRTPQLQRSRLLSLSQDIRINSAPVSASWRITLRQTSRTYASEAAAMPASPSVTSLTWNEFLKLRKTRRRFNQVSSVFLSFTSLGVGVALLQDLDLEAMSQMFFGMDPMFVMAFWTLGFVGAGWFLGPSLGGLAFRLAYRGKRGAMQLKERDFFDRIRKYRVDPTSSSMQNPVPDYYGEKISSVAGYRQWLKDQRAFNKKRQRFV